MQKRAGVDLGAANLVSSLSGEGVVLCEPSAIAVDRTTGQALYYGAKAEKLLEAPPANIQLLRPFRTGITSEIEMTQKILSDIIGGKLRGVSHLALSVPCSMGEIEEGALAEITAQCDIRYPHTVYSPIAALAGSGTGIYNQTLVVETGATATNIALVCDGEILYMKSVPTAGEAYDRAIAAYLLRERGVKVSLRTAESVKMTIGSVWTENTKQEMQVVARDTDKGQPVSVLIRSEEMYQALEEPTALILEAICVAVSHIPTKYVHQVFANGIILAGGTSLLDGLDRMISGVTGIRTVKSRSPVTAVALGLTVILDSFGERGITSVRNLSGMYLNKCRATLV